MNARRHPTPEPAGYLISEVRAAQAHGRQKYGGSPDHLAHDDAHTAEEWARFIKDHTTRAERAPRIDSREHFIKVAGLALSAVEAIDRKLKAEGIDMSEPDSPMPAAPAQPNYFGESAADPRNERCVCGHLCGQHSNACCLMGACECDAFRPVTVLDEVTPMLERLNHLGGDMYACPKCGKPVSIATANGICVHCNILVWADGRWHPLSAAEIDAVVEYAVSGGKRILLKDAPRPTPAAPATPAGEEKSE